MEVMVYWPEERACDKHNYIFFLKYHTIELIFREWLDKSVLLPTFGLIVTVVDTLL